MPLIQIRKKLLTVETIHHEGGPAPAVPLRMAAAGAVVRNPYAGRYEPDLLPFMAALRGLGLEPAEEVAAILGKGQVEAYGKAAIVGINGELEHGAIWPAPAACRSSPRPAATSSGPLCATTAPTRCSTPHCPTWPTG